MLSDFDAAQLFYTIPDFHDTRKRYAKLREDAQADPCGRVSEVRQELDWLLSVEDEACKLTDLYNAGELPLRVTHNDIGRHQSRLVRTRVASNRSPWLMYTQPGEVYTCPISHGEGRFIASDELVARLARNGQIATQYCDNDGRPTMDLRFNPNGSVDAIEGITSPDGRVFGKMGHIERSEDKITIR